MTTYYVTSNPAVTDTGNVNGYPQVGFTHTPQDGDVFYMDSSSSAPVTFNGTATYTVNYDQDIPSTNGGLSAYHNFESGSNVTVNISAGTDISAIGLTAKGESFTVNIDDGASFGVINAQALERVDGSTGFVVNGGHNITGNWIGGSYAGANSNITFGDNLDVFSIDGTSTNPSVYPGATNDGVISHITLGDGAKIEYNMFNGGSAPGSADLRIEVGNNANIAQIQQPSNGATSDGTIIIGDGLTGSLVRSWSTGHANFQIGDNWSLNTIVDMYGTSNMIIGGMKTPYPGPYAQPNVLGQFGFDTISIKAPIGKESVFENAATAAGWTVDGAGYWSPPEGTTIDTTILSVPGVIQMNYFEGPAEPIPCFVRGTLIKTIKGEVAVEDLVEGDMVLTMDADYQPIRWIGGRKISLLTLIKNPKLQPIRIKTGALGSNLPEKDLVVSPQHRILARNKLAERIFGDSEVLIPANKLLALPGIDIDHEMVEVEYFHMLLDTHQIIFSNGSPTETLFTGTEAIAALTPDAFDEIKTLFPEILAPEFIAEPVRHIPKKGKHMKVFAERLAKNNKAMVEWNDIPSYKEYVTAEGRMTP